MMQVNPTRFRHTAAVRLFHLMQMDAPTICHLLGVTPEVMTTYVMRPKWEVAMELKEKGW
jgi:hypothetical protein